MPIYIYAAFLEHGAKDWTGLMSYQVAQDVNLSMLHRHANAVMTSTYVPQRHLRPPEELVLTMLACELL